MTKQKLSFTSTEIKLYQKIFKDVSLYSDTKKKDTVR